MEIGQKKVAVVLRPPTDTRGCVRPNYGDIVTGVNTPLNAMLEQTKVSSARRTLGRPTLKHSNHRSNTNVHFARYLLNREPCSSHAHHFIAIEYPPRTPNSIPSLRAVCLRGFHPGADPFSNQLPFELSHGCKDMHQELTCRVGLVRIQACDVAMKRIPMLAKS